MRVKFDATAHVNDNIGSLDSSDRHYRGAKCDARCHPVSDVPVSCIAVRRGSEFLCCAGNVDYRCTPQGTGYSQKVIVLVALNQ